MTTEQTMHEALPEDDFSRAAIVFADFIPYLEKKDRNSFHQVMPMVHEFFKYLAKKSPALDTASPAQHEERQKEFNDENPSSLLNSATSPLQWGADRVQMGRDETMESKMEPASTLQNEENTNVGKQKNTDGVQLFKYPYKPNRAERRRLMKLEKRNGK